MNTLIKLSIKKAQYVIMIILLIMSIQKGQAQERQGQTITFAPMSIKTFGDVPFVLSATSSMGLPVVFSASHTIISIRRDTVRINETGMVSITAYNTGNENYQEASATQMLLINDPRKRNATITFTIPLVLLLEKSYILTATSNSPMPIIFIASDTNTVSIRGNTLTAKANGTVIITASQEGNAEYNAGTAHQTRKVGRPPCCLPPEYFLTSIEKENSAIRIYPNPANDYITIKTDVKISSVKIYDITGKNYELGIRNYELGLRVDLKTLPKGEYIIILYGEKGEVLKAEKVIKE